MVLLQHWTCAYAEVSICRSLKSLSLTFRICEQCSGSTNNHLSSQNFMLVSSLELKKKGWVLISWDLTWELSYSVLPISSVHQHAHGDLGPDLKWPSGKSSCLCWLHREQRKTALLIWVALENVQSSSGQIKSWAHGERDSFVSTEASEPLEMFWHMWGVSLRSHRRHWLPWSCRGGQAGYTTTPHMARDARTLPNILAEQASMEQVTTAVKLRWN